MVKIWRKIFLILKPFFHFYPPLIYSYFFGAISFILASIWIPLSYPLRAIFPTVYINDFRWSILDTFDSISTVYQKGFHPKEIKKLLILGGFKKITQKKINSNDFIAVK